MIAHCRDFFARNPQWWALLLSACAWITLPAIAHPAHEMSSMSGSEHVSHALTPRWSDAFNWIAMTTAMMLPLTASSVQTVAIRSLWNRRHRAIAFFLLAYVTCWVIAGLFLNAAFRATLHTAVSTIVLLPITLGIAAVWELTSLKELALRRCHRTEPLAPVGWRADWSCIRFGFRQGSACIVSCWALMLVPLAIQHSLASMAGVELIALTGRCRADRKPHMIAAGLLAGAMLAVLVKVRAQG